MGSSFASNMQQPLYHTAPLTVDTKHAQKYFEDDDNNSGNVMDDTILDSSAIDSGLELSPPMVDSRRESLALGGAPLFSPKREDWHAIDMQSLPSNNPFFEQHNSNPFMRVDQNHDGSFAQQGSGWAFPHMDDIQVEYDTNASVFRNLQGQTPFTHPGNMFAGHGSGANSIPTSPHKDFAGSNQSVGKRTRPASPIIRAHRDGIRKKNARFDIPPERTLSNIDRLISEEKDEKKAKELKQQKRLLRNRQAALDSRQRKKQHTERLEDEKKQFTGVISDMEEEINELKARMDLLLRENKDFSDYIKHLQTERDEMIVTHTNESAGLRKKIAVLSDHVRRLEPNVTSAPSSNANANANNAFPSAYGEMDDLTMGGPWEHPNFLNNYPTETEPKQELPIVPVKKHATGFNSEGEKASSQQGGLLFMLFLVGAFVLSNRSTPTIPRVSEDVRDASRTILNNVLKDAGVGATQTSNMQAIAPQPSGTWTGPSANMPMNDMNVDTVTPSMLGDLSNSLTQPTQEQTNEQLFSLSAAQYNGVHNQDFLLNNQPERFYSQGRKTLAEALSAMRMTDKQDGAAQVYTRSLLWDQIPGDVVRNFAKMVAECNNAQNEQQCNEAIP